WHNQACYEPLPSKLQFYASGIANATTAGTGKMLTRAVDATLLRDLKPFPIAAIELFRREKAPYFLPSKQLRQRRERMNGRVCERRVRASFKDQQLGIANTILHPIRKTSGG